MALAGRIIVYGGKGALGSVIVNAFKAKNYVCNIFNLSDIIHGVVMLYFLLEAGIKFDPAQTEPKQIRPYAFFHISFSRQCIQG